MVNTFSLPYRIYSSPVAWPTGTAPQISIAAVFGERQGSATTPFVAGFDARGTIVPGFPWLRASPMAVSPGNALVMASPSGDLLAIDASGRLRRLVNGYDAQGSPLSEVLGLIATAPVAIGSPPRAWAVLSRDARPHVGSRNAVAILAEGRMAPGFPAELSGIPETQPPVVDPTGTRVYVMLRTGQVDGFDIRSGTRLPGFPTALPAAPPPRPLGGYRAATAGVGLLVVSGANHLMRIVPGRPPRTVMTGARRFEAIASTDGSLIVAWDSVSGGVALLTAEGGERGMHPLPQVFGTEAPFLAMADGNLALVGAETSDVRGRVDQLFEERANAAAKAEVMGIAEEEAQIRYGSAKPTGVDQAQAQADLRQLKKGWLERTYGLRAVEAMLRTAPATRITVVRGLGTERPGVLVDERIEGFAPQTGFDQCEHVLPVFWRDPRNGGSVLLVGLNSTTSPTSTVRVYPIDVR